MQRRGFAGALAGLCLTALLPLAAQAQDIAVLDERRLFTESLFGARVTRETQDAVAVVVAENKQIETQLEAEERALADQRAVMDPQEFRTLADAFDVKVTALRQERNEREQGVARRVQDEEQRFQELANEILARFVREQGISLVLPASVAVFHAADRDITSTLIALIDAEFGDGALPTAD
jgi:Skp family chaperone for outer membrane proteins